MVDRPAYIVFLTRCICIASLLLMLCCPLTLFAQADESEQLAQAKARIAELEKEVRVLTAKLTLLETQMKNQAEAAGQHATSSPNPSKAADASVKPNDTTTEQPKQPLKPVRKFQTLLQPMQQLPVNLRPHNGEWDGMQVDAANLWLSQNIPGNTLESKFNIRVHVFSRSKKLMGDKYVYTSRLWLYFTTPNISYIGVDFKPSFMADITVDEKLAEAYQKLDPNIALRVTGRLKEYKVNKSTLPQSASSLYWKLEDWKIHSPYLPD